MVLIKTICDGGFWNIRRLALIVLAIGLFSVFIEADENVAFNSRICKAPMAPVPQTDPLFGTDSVAWIVDSNAALVNCPENGSPISFPRPFGKRFYLADQEQKLTDKKNSSWQLLLTKGINASKEDYFQPIGWIQSKGLLLNDSPLKDEQTNMDIKAISFQGKKQRGKSQFAVYASPDLSGKPILDLNRKAIYYVYEVYPRRLSRTLKRDRLRGAESLLIGVNPLLDSFADKENSGLKGWVKTDNIEIWNNKLALQFKEPIPVYESRRAAKLHKVERMIDSVYQKEMTYDETRSLVLEQYGTVFKIIYFKHHQATDNENETKMGWVNLIDSRGRQVNIERVALVGYPDLVRLAGVLSDLQAIPVRTRTLSWRWSQILDAYTNKRCHENEKLERCFQRKGSIPLKIRFLHYSLNELLEISRTDREDLFRIKCEMKIAAEKLKDLIEENRLEYQIYNLETCSLKPHFKEEIKIWFHPTKSGELAWIPLKYLP